MGKRTSVYLADDLAAAVDKTGLPLADIIRRGLYGPPARPVVVPMRRRREQVPQADVVPPPDVVVPAATEAMWYRQPSWRCEACSWLQAQPEVTHCESCGWPAGVPR